MRSSIAKVNFPKVFVAIRLQLLVLGSVLGFTYSLNSFSWAPDDTKFHESRTCIRCHSTHYREWKGSMHSYGARSPVFQAMELAFKKITGKFGHDDPGPLRNACIKCHAPIADFDGETKFLTNFEPSAEILRTSRVSQDSVSCTVCHSAKEADKKKNPAAGLLGDGFSGVAVILDPSFKFYGPTPASKDLEHSSYHGFKTTEKTAEYFKSTRMCASCHDVRIPGKDAITGEPFKRVEDLSTEHENSPYATKNNPHGKPISCRDCHMSLYAAINPKTKKPYPPGTYPEMLISSDSTKARPHKLHNFTAVSTSLLGETKELPNQDKPGKYMRDWNMPIGQQQRREQLLKIAVTMKLAAAKQPAGYTTLPVTVTLNNTGAGHRVPSGFSQERDMWLEITVRGKPNNGVGKGELVYRSGYLIDKPHRRCNENEPDGLLHDEDVEDVYRTVSPRTFKIIKSKLGPDFNYRPFAQMGVARFTNAFLKKVGRGKFEEVLFPFQADAIDNTRALPPLKDIPIQYDVSLREFYKKYPKFRGSLTITVRLLFRSFFPKFLRILAQREPEILTEKMIDRNTIVEMAKKVLTLNDVRAPSKLPRNKCADVTLDPRKGRIFRRSRKEMKGKEIHPETWWAHFYDRSYYPDAEKTCAAIGYNVASIQEYESLDFDSYVPAIGDNKEELQKERFTRNRVEGNKNKVHTYNFLRAGDDDRIGQAGATDESFDTHYFSCTCQL